MKIEKAIIINGLTLIVYYTPGKCWQYAIASENGSYQCEGIFYTSQGAEDEGRRQIQMLLG
jgi:hypothetical protein